MDRTSIRTDRQEAVSKLFSIADANPVKMPSGYKFNRDECYDEEDYQDFKSIDTIGCEK
jgi:hypothetical protein